MKFLLAHANINVTDMQRSIDFYKKAFKLTAVREKTANDGAYKIVFMADEREEFMLELTWLKDKQGRYELGDNESHIAFITDDFDAAYDLHKEMGCICYENPKMGIYFVEDPDGYWMEVLPPRK
ncbi:MAG: Lactoylglutathione lyase [Firmicutes bacterium ADurb.Bin182]|nr:MAG: Lactoylglutathione lyase [Firmicutes bacterium ADurb.Bin182]